MQPLVVMGELLATTFAVQRYVVTALILVFLVTLATAGLVFGLFLRLRRSEIQTMVKIGDSHRRIAAFMGSQMLATMVVGALVTGLLTWLSSGFGAAVILALILA